MNNKSPNTSFSNVNNNSYSNSNVSFSDKNEIDRISEQQPENDIKDAVDKILENWSKGVSEQKNLLMLLATLHEVWSKDDKLKDISVREMVDDHGLASRMYRKAMLLFHDDKIKKLSYKYQYTAKSLYYLLTKAHEDFREKPKY